MDKHTSQWLIEFWRILSASPFFIEHIEYTWPSGKNRKAGFAYGDEMLAFFQGISSNLGVIFQLTLSLRPGAGLVVHLADFDENWVGGIVALWISRSVTRFAWRVLLHEVFWRFFHRLSSASTLNNGRGVPKSRLAEKWFWRWSAGGVDVNIIAAYWWLFRLSRSSSINTKGGFPGQTVFI